MPNISDVLTNARRALEVPFPSAQPVYLASLQHHVRFSDLSDDQLSEAAVMIALLKDRLARA